MEVFNELMGWLPPNGVAHRPNAHHAAFTELLPTLGLESSSTSRIRSSKQIHRIDPIVPSDAVKRAPM